MKNFTFDASCGFYLRIKVAQSSEEHKCKRVKMNFGHSPISHQNSGKRLEKVVK